MNHLNKIIVKPLIIHQSGDISISVGQSFDNEIVNLLKRTVYGTKGPRYQHSGQEMKLANLKSPIFFTMKNKEEIIGFYCICEREIGIGSESFMGYYGRYFVIDKNYQGNDFGKLILKIANEYIEKESISPSVIYGYVEENNARSLNVSQKLGLSSISTLETIIFSRLYPKKNTSVSRLHQSEIPTILSKLESQNSSTILRTFENINYQDNYFVIKEKGVIVAGLQANPVCWKIKEMEGVGGKILLKILPHIPILKRLINPNKYDFLAIEGLFVENGYEEYLYDLLGGVLHQFNMTSALIQLDSKSPFLKLFKEKKNLGLLNSMKKEVKTHVMIKTINFDKSIIKEGEVYISSFDFT
jgi:GNAT superfamily N-acetyltransferase